MLFPWEFSSGRGLSGMLPSGRAGLCSRAELGIPGLADVALADVEQQGQCQAPGAWQSWLLPLTQKGFCLGFLPTENEQSQWSSPLCIYVGKESQEAFPQRCKRNCYFLSALFLSEQKCAEYIHTEGSSIAECMFCEAQAEFLMLFHD